MTLSETKVRNAKPREKPFKLYDERGLFIIIQPKGGKWWRFKYRFNGKEKSLSLGTYPDVGLKSARGKRDDHRKLLYEKGIDPARNRQTLKHSLLESSENTFETIARLWFKKNNIWKPSHARTVIGRLERDIFPWIGNMAISEITSRDVSIVLNRVEKRGAVETAHRELGIVENIYSFAVASGITETNVATPLSGTLAKVQKKHLAAIVEEKPFGALLRAIDTYEGTFIVSCALRLLPLIFVRPGELRHAEWSEFDLVKAEWLIPAGKMKMKVQHLVPLSTQALKILTDLQPLTVRGKYVFPSARSQHRPMSDNAILSALRRMGYSKEEVSGHGFRATARTMLDEQLGFRPDIIEHQLAHAVKDPNGRAYNRTTFLSDRREMMQAWADYLVHLKSRGEVVSLNEHISK